MFAYIFFHVFQRTSNMYTYLGLRVGQSYPGVFGRKLPMAGGLLSDELMINVHTIARFHMYVASCLDAGVIARRQKLGVYNAHVICLRRKKTRAGELLDK